MAGCNATAVRCSDKPKGLKSGSVGLRRPAGRVSAYSEREFELRCDCFSPPDARLCERLVRNVEVGERGVEAQAYRGGPLRARAAPPSPCVRGAVRAALRRSRVGDVGNQVWCEKE